MISAIAGLAGERDFALRRSRAARFAGERN
jgi:hypothetical protein